MLAVLAKLLAWLLRVIGTHLDIDDGTDNGLDVTDTSAG